MILRARQPSVELARLIRSHGHLCFFPAGPQLKGLLGAALQPRRFRYARPPLSRAIRGEAVLPFQWLRCGRPLKGLRGECPSNRSVVIAFARLSTCPSGVSRPSGPAICSARSGILFLEVGGTAEPDTLRFLVVRAPVSTVFMSAIVPHGVPSPVRAPRCKPGRPGRRAVENALQ